eukprot:161098_1
MFTVKKVRQIWQEKYQVISAVTASLVGVYVGRRLYCYIYQKYNKYPPGPNGLPLIGHLFSMLNPPKLSAFLATTYGPISMIYVAQQPFVFLNSIDAINDIFNNPHCLQRDDWTKGSGYHKAHEMSTAQVNSPFWMEKRKIFQSILISRLDSRFLNAAHNKSVTEVLQSVQNCIEQNQLWFPAKDLEYIMFNAIWNAAFGSDLPMQSEIQNKITKFIVRGLKQAVFDIGMMQLGLLNIPFIKALSYSGKEFCDYIETLIYDKLGYDEKIWDMHDLKWAKHFQDAHDDKHSCLISKLIAVHRSKPDITSTKDALLAEGALLFVAGIDTTQNVAEYGVLLLAKYPKYQSVIYHELYSVFGSDWEMKENSFKSVANKLHYLRAFVHETVRLANVLPIGIPHRNDEDIWTKDKKYKIPKNSVVISGIHVADKSDAYWVDNIRGNPSRLCLEAWFDDNGHFSYLVNKDKMMGFSVGPRNCLGRALALRSLYVLFIKLIL